MTTTMIMIIMTYNYPHYILDLSKSPWLWLPWLPLPQQPWRASVVPELERPSPADRADQAAHHHDDDDHADQVGRHDIHYHYQGDQDLHQDDQDLHQDDQDLHLHPLDHHPPGSGGHVQHGLHLVRDRLPLRKDLSQVQSAEHVSGVFLIIKMTTMMQMAMMIMIHMMKMMILMTVNGDHLRVVAAKSLADPL